MRTTTDKKEYSLRIRINAEMYRYLKSTSGDGKISEYIREMIKREMSEKTAKSKKGHLKAF